MVKSITKGWIIECSDGVIFLDKKEDRYWLGGSPSIIGVAFFHTKERAMSERKKIQKAWKNKPYAQKWYAVKELIYQR